MNLSVDVLSAYWQRKQAGLAEAGLLHGRDYITPTCIPGLGSFVTDLTPNNIPMGKLAVIGAKTGNNKTRFLWNLAADVVRQGLNVGFASLEVSAEESSPSICSILTCTSKSLISPGKYYDAQVAKNVAAEMAAKKKTGQWGSLHITSEVGSVNGADDLISWMAMLNAGPEVSVFFIDYFQLLAQSGDVRRFGELNEAVLKLVEFIKATKALVVVASQFNRGSSQAKRRPDNESLDSCPMLERYAHFIWLLDHTRDDDEEYRKRTWLIVGKNRHGRGGEIPIEFNYRNHTMREGARLEVDALWP